jgi:predicted ATPase/class 3 adenylate cyclase/DNA-binding CsgD family transcriptional regulator
MSEIQPRIEMPVLSWSDDDVSGRVPTGTVTLLLADVEGSTRLWETASEEMTAAFANLDCTLDELVSAHRGVRPVEQGEGDSFVVAFTSASDAVACALALQLAPLAPIRLRIGVHTGEVRLRDEGNYIGPAINRAARLRELAHGGQTVLSGTTTDLVADLLPDGAWLNDLGSHPLRDLPRPERVVQLCHPDLHNEFPPLRGGVTVAAQRLPVQLTSFVGRIDTTNEIARLMGVNRLVTLTGAGGVGKTRLAVHIATERAAEFGDGAWYVDLASTTDPDMVPVTTARALGLPDQPGRSTMDTLLAFIRDRHILVVLDNCEHLLDACVALCVSVLGAAPRLTVLATSREPLGVTGEATWRVPSLSLTDEAIELFTERARLAQADFRVTDDNAAHVTEICRRLDGIPLAIELAAARVRALSPVEIVDSLHDRFRLLTGGSRTAVRRQQTLRASVDWSHALLTRPERVLFRRLAVFLGGFDLYAAEAVAGHDEMERYQVLDQLTLLVDKSLVVADDSTGRTRYRLLETMRQYAQEKLGESDESDAVRSRHRDYYTAMADTLDAPAGDDYERRIEQAEAEIDNLRAAFDWSHENSDIELELRLACSLQPLWLARGRLREGLVWIDAALADLDAQHPGVAPAVRGHALAARAALGLWMGSTDSLSQAQQALAIAREVDDRALLGRALTVCGLITAIVSADMAEPYFAEAIGVTRALDDRWRLSQILACQATVAATAGYPKVARGVGKEGRDLAEAVGDRFVSRLCRFCLGAAQLFQGDLVGAAAQLGELVAEARVAHDLLAEVDGLAYLGVVLAWQGDTPAARATADAAIEAGAEVGGIYAAVGYAALAGAALAAGDSATARNACEAWPQLSVLPQTTAMWRALSAWAALAGGDLAAARRWADEAVTGTTGYFLSAALLARAQVATAQGQPDQGERDAHDALACAKGVGAYLHIPETLECLADLARAAGRHREAARLFGAAYAARERVGAVRLKVWDEGYGTSLASVRDTLGENGFESTWAEGAALSVEEAIAYAQRGRGERKRAATGWDSLTPAEREVERLVSEGLSNKDIAARLFISPRTVQSHLTHVYAKLNVTSRMQLAHEAARQHGHSDEGPPQP